MSSRFGNYGLASEGSKSLMESLCYMLVPVREEDGLMIGEVLVVERGSEGVNRECVWE